MTASKPGGRAVTPVATSTAAPDTDPSDSPITRAARSVEAASADHKRASEELAQAERIVSQMRERAREAHAQLVKAKKELTDAIRIASGHSV